MYIINPAVHATIRSIDGFLFLVSIGTDSENLFNGHKKTSEQLDEIGLLRLVDGAAHMGDEAFDEDPDVLSYEDPYYKKL